MKQIIHLCICLATVTVLFTDAAASNRQPIAGFAEETSPVYTVDLWQLLAEEGFDTTEERVNTVYFLTSLQGIVNREAPRLFIDCSYNFIGGELDFTHEVEKGSKVDIQELDSRWWQWFVDQRLFGDREIIELQSLEDVLRAFSNDFRGFVMWDMATPSSVNLALTAAGAEDLLPVSKDLDKGSLFSRLREIVPQAPVSRDFSGMSAKEGFKIGEKRYGSSGSAKVDVYRQMIDRYIRTEQVDPGYLWFNVDAAAWGELRNVYGQTEFGHLGDRNEIQQNGLYNVDYWVSKKGIFLDLFPFSDELPNDDPDQKLGADELLWHDILELTYHQRDGEFGVVGGFVPWWIKYAIRESDGKMREDVVSVEVRFIALASSYNLWNDADAAFGISNASFYQHLDKPDPELFHNSEIKSPKKPEDGHAYVSFYMLDYDGSAWLNQAAFSVFDTAGRGEIPLNWAINPILADRVPHAFHYILSQRTELDFFGMSDDGAGYVDPYYLVSGQRLGRIQESGLEYYKKAAQPYYDEQAISLTAFHITRGFEGDWMDTMAELSPVGIGLNRAPEMGEIGSPITDQLIEIHHRNLSGMERQLDEIFRRSQSGGIITPEFYGFRCILARPAYIVEMIQRLELKYPDAQVNIVDAFNYYRLKGAAQERISAANEAFRSAELVSSSPNSSEGMRAIHVNDGQIKVVNYEGDAVWQSHLEQPNQSRFVYFKINPGFSQELDSDTAELVLDLSCDTSTNLQVQYNGKSNDGKSIAYKQGQSIQLSAGKRQLVRIPMVDVLFRHSQNGAADLRVQIVSAGEVYIQSAKVTRMD